MKIETTKINSATIRMWRSATIICAGIVLALAAGARAQNLFVSAGADGSIYEFTPSASRSTFASTGLQDPVGLAFNGAGDLFVADQFYNEIYKFAPGYVNGSPLTAFASMSTPLALAFNAAGDLFASDTGGIIEIDPLGGQTTFASGLSVPYALAFNSAGDLFEADLNSGNIYEFAPGYHNGDPLTVFASGLVHPAGLAFDSAGDLFVSDGGNGALGNGRIYEFAPGYANGDPLTTFASGLSDPAGLAFNSTGDLFEGDGGSGNIYEFAPGYANGDPLTIFASGAGQAQGLAFQGEALPVPEPSTWALLGSGMAALLGFRRRR